MSETTRYAVLLHGDETVWREATPEQRAAIFAAHERFARACAERGHVIVGGAELGPAAGSTLVRASEDGSALVTDGPLTERVEQLGGFYLIDTDDLSDLARLSVGIIGTGTVELRPVATGS